MGGRYSVHHAVTVNQLYCLRKLRCFGVSASFAVKCKEVEDCARTRTNQLKYSSVSSAVSMFRTF